MQKIILSLDESGLLNLLGLRQCRSLFELAVKDPSCDYVLLTGEERRFCCGLSLPENPDEMLSEFEQLLKLIFFMPKPVVVHVNGHAVGGGLILAACGDWIVASDNSRIKLGLPELNVGLSLTPMMVDLLAYRLKSRSAVEGLLYSGEFGDVRQYSSRGLVDVVLSESECEQSVESAGIRMLRSGCPAFSKNKAATRFCVVS